MTMRSITRLRWVPALLLSAGLLGCAAPRPQKVEPSRQQAKAMEMFAERCKKAGEFIHRTVQDVEGVFLLKLRPKEINYGDQFRLDDPYGSDLGGDGYIVSLLRGSYEANHSGTPIAGAPPTPKGYLYVDAVDPKDGVRYRYTGGVRETEAVSSILMGGTGQKFKTVKYVLDRMGATGAAPRYGITYDDISTREEREHWIAGSSLRVVDLQTNEVIAERVGYMVDVYQGSRAGGRAPWLFAADNACPSFQRNSLRPPGHGAESQSRQTQYFVEKVLKPKLTLGK